MDKKYNFLERDETIMQTTVFFVINFFLFLVKVFRNVIENCIHLNRDQEASK
jgi:hypothetical protein